MLDWYRRQMADPVADPKLADPKLEPEPELPEPASIKAPANSPAARIVAAIQESGGFVKVDAGGRLSWSVMSGTPERRAALRDAVRRYQADIIRLVMAVAEASP